MKGFFVVIATTMLVQGQAQAEIVELNDPKKVECKIEQRTDCTSAGNWTDWCFEIKYDSKTVFEESIKSGDSDVKAERAKLSCVNIVAQAVASNGYLILNSDGKANSNRLLYISNIQSSAELLKKVMTLEESTDRRLKTLENKVFGN
jgi:hypothetical protein